MNLPGFVTAQIKQIFFQIEQPLSKFKKINQIYIFKTYKSTVPEEFDISQQNTLVQFFYKKSFSSKVLIRLLVKVT